MGCDWPVVLAAVEEMGKVADRNSAGPPCGPPCVTHAATLPHERHPRHLAHPNTHICSTYYNSTYVRNIVSAGRRMLGSVDLSKYPVRRTERLGASAVPPRTRDLIAGYVAWIHACDYLPATILCWQQALLFVLDMHLPTEPQGHVRGHVAVRQLLRHREQQCQP